MDTSTVLSLVGIGVAIVIGGIAQTDWKHKGLVYGFIAAGFVVVVIGLTFPWLRDWMPAAAVFVAKIATNPALWFSILVLLFAAHLAIRRRGAPVGPPIQEIATLREEIQKLSGSQGEANASLSGMIGKVEDKADKIAANVQVEIKSIREEIQNLFKRTERQYELTGQGQMRLRTAILARDAEALIKVQDKVIVELGGRLLAADSPIYLNSDSPTKAWLADYAVWEQAFGETDRIIGLWQSNYRRHLDLNRRDYEQTSHLPPDSINSDSTIITRFKTVCIVQERYMSTRKNIAEYFSAKVRDSLA